MPAPLPSPPGTNADPGVMQARQAVLRRYYDGPIEERPYIGSYTLTRLMEREADLAWVMEYGR